MRTKSKIVFDFSTQNDYDIIVLVETWLNNDFSDAEFFDANLYNVYRKDRNAELTGLSVGGGVLIAVRSSLKSSFFNFNNHDGLLDQLIVSISAKNFSVYLCASYIPPNSSDDLYAAHISNITSLGENLPVNAHLCLLGDFNLKNIFWSNLADNSLLSPRNVNRNHEINFIDNLMSLNLVQINSFPNQLNRFLDLVFVPDYYESKVYTPLLSISRPNMHHLPLAIIIENLKFFKYDYNMISDRNNLNFKSCNFDVLISTFDSIDFCSLFSGLTTSECYDKFLDIVLAICRDNTPTRYRKPYKLPWYTSGLKRLKNLRNKFHKQFIISGDSESQNKFVHYNREFNFLNKFLYKQFLLAKEQEIKSNPKSFWSFVKAKRQSSDIPSTVRYGGDVSVSCNDAANMFASFFESNFEPQTSNSLATSNFQSNLNIGLLVLTEEEVLNAILQAKDSFKTDIDGLCTHILKRCAISLTPALTYIFNLSLREGIFISCWKTAIITPVFKDGRRDDVSCYRPISKLSCVSKIFEHITHKKLFFLTKTLITPYQHGFYSGRSTVTNLILFSDYCLNALEKRSQVEVVYTDFSKAFDKLCHSILLSKLKKFGFHSKFLEWIKSYLSDRICKVQIENYESRPYFQTSGVPQGSILGPLLFNLFVNDISFCFIRSKFLLYADDLKVFLKIDSVSDAADLQHDLNNLNAWCSLNSLHLNIGKCLHISFHKSLNPTIFVFNINGINLQKVSTKLDLGVLFDSAMSFVPHVEYILPRAYKMLAFLRRNCSEFFNPYTLKHIYTSFVRSKLEYASVVWNPHASSYIYRLERLQRIFIKFATRSLNYLDSVPYESKCLFIGLKSLEFRRNVQSALLVYDIVNANIECSDLLSLLPFYIPPRRLRHVNIFNVPFHRTNYALNGPLTRACIRINEINLYLQRTSESFVDFSITKDNFKLLLFIVIR